ncbi:TPA: helix-turn-helix transcriptional regulator [Candidatus Scatousia excrementigallinarum]|uniref:Helix-turn-helix transcriptional regulator n=1 Tax=Candidatus Scatousia excrementigallinarum TaxID=2840935 RepID=A0A9D1F292_9BACT|nr:helix-turn-helix transcriptional regulator [Candidatus Scatousia excrementigallinarum]
MQKYEVMYHKIISANIKKLRKSLKLSQEEFAEKLNCSREFISRVENLKEKVSLKMLLKLSELFKVNPTYFFEED